MLEIASRLVHGNDENLFSAANASDARRALAWFEDRVRRGRGGVVTETVKLTPALAELLLSKNPDNRNLRDRLVEIYAADMRNGDWSLNGEGIKVSLDGLLNDGQHRCQAVVRSGRSIDTLITFGLARDSRMTVDQGGVRTAGNYLAMSGVENSNVVAAVAGMVWQLQTLRRISRGGHDKPTKAQVRMTARQHPEISASIKGIPSHARVGRSQSVLVFCHYLLTQRVAAREDVDAFFRRLVLGESLTRNDPIYHCRERLISNQRMMLDEKVEIILRTWNAHRKGQKQTKCSPVLGELPVVEV